MNTQVWWRMLFTGVLAMACSHSYAQCKKIIVSADPAYPPLHWFDGTQLQGASIEIARRVLEELQIPFEVRYSGPFPRLIKLAQQGDIDMIATLKKTPEREGFLLFPTTPALSNPVAAFALKDRSFEFKSRQSLVGRKVGITRGNVFGDGVDDFIKQELMAEETNSPEQNFEKLGLGRIDFFITGYYTGIALLLKRGEEQRFVAMSPYLTETPNYLALTRNGKCADKLAQIDAKLAQLKKSGALDALIRKSFQQWKARPVLAEK